MKSFLSFNLLIILIILVIFIFVSLILYKNKNNFENNINCSKDGKPIKNEQNILYRIHEEFKKKRDNNHLLSRKTEKSNFIFPEKGPANMFIIRHAEKDKYKVALDSNGILRSTYIPFLIEDLNKKGYGIHSIITANDYNSMHQEQTVLLTSWLYSIPLYIYSDSTDPEKTVNTIFSNSYFNGKTILICWEHNCIQELLKYIIKIGSKKKGLNDYIFKNTEGTSELPYWNTNNFKSIYHLDDKLNFSILEENFTTCYKKDNNLIYYGKQQKCVNKNISL